ncbi:MAG: superoxide dismutase family protein [Chromatiaceae bacterium]
MKDFASNSDRFRPVMLIAATLLALGPTMAAAEGMKATADIKGCNDPNITGTATLTEQVTPEGIKEVKVTMDVSGLSDGKHAVHIHQTGACEPCSAAKGHHDPGPFGQTRPDSASDEVPAKDVNHPYHMGDLINIDVKNGKGHMETVTNRVTLSPGRLSIFDADGSAIIIHTNPDTYCDQESDLKKGCAGGARDACGVLKMVKE